jgi:hypothetical protein
MDNSTILQSLADNPALFDAAKAEILKKFDLSQIKLGDINNVDLSDMVRARLIGAELVEDAFKEISRHRTRDIPRGGVNPAR